MFNFRDLIDLAIGSPESGHVNFYALHVLLSNMAHRLDMLDEIVEYDEVLLANMKGQSSLIGRSSRYRIFAGGEAEEGEAVTEDVPVQKEAPDNPEPAQEAPIVSEEVPITIEEQQMPEPTPATDQYSVPATGPASVPVTAPGSVPGTAPGSVPGTAPGSVPGTAPGTAPTTAPGSVRTSRAELDEQRSALAVKTQRSRIEVVRTQELEANVNTMSNYVKLTIEQLNNVTHLLLDRKPDPERVKHLRELAIELHALLHPDVEVSSWVSMEQLFEEPEAEEEEELELLPSSSSKEPVKEEEEETLELDQHLCYTMERMLNELLELKSDFCTLTNKVNELAAALLKQDCQRIMNMMQELQEQLRELKQASITAREAFEGIVIKVNNNSVEIQLLKKATANLDDVKIDKTEVEILLAEKVDFQQLQTKVSIEQLEEFKSKLEKQFCEVRAIMNANEKNVLYIIDNLRATLGLDALELNLKDFRDLIEKRVQMLAESLQRYMDMTNDDCAAAAGRVKVLQDLSCLSCDTPCVMRTVERAKVGKLPNAKGSTSMGPLVTYELGSIRKSGIMGYYRKDEYPHSQDAWLKAPKAPMNNCIPRHAGGEHTIHTAEEHMQKVVLSKRNAGWK